MPESSTKTGKYLDSLPSWVRELSEKYYSRSFALFVLYGNVRDCVPLRTPDGATNFVLNSVPATPVFDSITVMNNGTDYDLV